MAVKLLCSRSGKLLRRPQLPKLKTGASLRHSCSSAVPRAIVHRTPLCAPRLRLLRVLPLAGLAPFGISIFQGFGLRAVLRHWCLKPGTLAGSALGFLVPTCRLRFVEMLRRPGGC